MNMLKSIWPYSFFKRLIKRLIFQKSLFAIEFFPVGHCEVVLRISGRGLGYIENNQVSLSQRCLFGNFDLKISVPVGKIFSVRLLDTWQVRYYSLDTNPERLAMWSKNTSITPGLRFNYSIFLAKNLIVEKKLPFINDQNLTFTTLPYPEIGIRLADHRFKGFAISKGKSTHSILSARKTNTPKVVRDSLLNKVYVPRIKVPKFTKSFFA